MVCFVLHGASAISFLLSLWDWVHCSARADPSTNMATLSTQRQMMLQAHHRTMPAEPLLSQKQQVSQWEGKG